MAKPGGDETSAETEVGPFHDEQNRHHAEGLPEIAGQAEFVGGAAEEIGQRENNASLANSDGCRLKKPRSNQRRAPPRTVPKNITLTRRMTEVQKASPAQRVSV